MHSLIGKEKKLLVWLQRVAILISGAVFVSIVINLGAITGDDETMIEYCRISFSELMRDIADNGLVWSRGRIIGLPLGLLLNWLQSHWQNLMVFRVFSCLGVFISLFSIYLFLKKLFYRNIAVLFSLMYLFFIEIYYTNYSGFISFGFSYQVMMAIAFFAMLSFLCYFDNYKAGYLWLSGALYFIVSSLYECYIMLCFVYLFIAIYKLKEKNNLKILPLIKALAVPAAFGALFSVIYIFGGGFISSSAVGGGYAVDGVANFSDQIRTLCCMTFSNFPLYLSFSGGSELWSKVFDSMLTLSFSNICIWIYVGFVSFIIVKTALQITAIGGKRTLAFSAASVFVALMLCVPIAITKKYIDHVITGYLINPGMSYHAYPFLIFAVMLAFVWLINLLPQKKSITATAVLVILIFCGCTTMGTNIYYKEILNRNYFCVDELITLPCFSKVSDGATIYTFGFAGFYDNDDYVERLIYDKTGKMVTVTSDLNEVAENQDERYYIKKNWSTGSALFTDLGEENYSHTVYLLVAKYDSEKWLIVEYGDDFEEFSSFPVDGVTMKNLENIEIEETESGRIYIRLDTTEAWDFRFTRIF